METRTKHHPFTAKLALIVFAALPMTLFMAATAAAKDRDKNNEIVPPDEPGQFHVGYTTLSAEMSGGRVTQIRVFYPTFEFADDQTRYTIQAAVGTYKLDSPLWAVEDAQPVPGRFPLVVFDHGAAAAGRDFQSVSQLPVHELLASHGIVMVVSLHSPNPIARVRDLPLVIDIMLDPLSRGD